MKAIKFFVNGNFNHTLFVKCCHRTGIKAYACADSSGIILDLDAFVDTPRPELPLYLALLQKDIENPLHRRDAYADEAANLLRFG